MNINRFCSFSTQRVIFSFVFCFLPISLSIGVLWNHLDSLSLFIGLYLILTKCGLLMVEITAIFCLVWESAKDKLLSSYCFFANIIIVFMMLLHVGSVFQYDSGIMKLKSEKTEYTKAASDLIELTNKLNTEQNTALLGAIKQDNNNRANRQALEVVINKTTESNADLVNRTIKSINDSEKINKNNIKTLLPLEYIESGAMYIVPILISFIIGIGALFISKTSIDMSEPKISPATVNQVEIPVITEQVSNNYAVTANAPKDEVVEDEVVADINEGGGDDTSLAGYKYSEVTGAALKSSDRNALLEKLRNN